MLAAQLGYQLATDAILLCESTLIVADSELSEWDVGVSVDIEVLRETCRSGCENAVKVMEGFRDVRQEAYKVRVMYLFEIESILRICLVR